MKKGSNQKGGCHIVAGTDRSKRINGKRNEPCFFGGGAFLRLADGNTLVPMIYCIKLIVKALTRCTMLRNNVELDLKTRLNEEGITQTKVAEMIGVSLPYVNRIIRGREQIVNKTFVKMLDELGYDVELTYVKRGDQ